MLESAEVIVVHVFIVLSSFIASLLQSLPLSYSQPLIEVSAATQLSHSVKHLLSLSLSQDISTDSCDLQYMLKVSYVMNYPNSTTHSCTCIA